MTGKIQKENHRKNTKRESRQGMERKEKRVSQENIESCSKLIILRNENNFKLSYEKNTNQVKGIVDEGRRFLSPKAEE